jgi:trans-aconitate methyltransferase
MIPTSLARCDPMRSENACGLLQMEYTVPPEVLYSAYWYRSGTNETMRKHLRGIAEQAAARASRPQARALDIGCNDGTRLRGLPAAFAKFGVDPSDVAAEAAGDMTVVQDLFQSAELAERSGNQPFDVITAIAMFYDLEDLMSRELAAKHERHAAMKTSMARFPFH